MNVIFRGRVESFDDMLIHMKLLGISIVLNVFRLIVNDIVFLVFHKEEIERALAPFVIIDVVMELLTITCRFFCFFPNRSIEYLF